MAKKKAPQDATMRNVRASNSKFDNVHIRIDELERRLEKLIRKVKKLKHGR